MAFVVVRNYRRNGDGRIHVRVLDSFILVLNWMFLARIIIIIIIIRSAPEPTILVIIMTIISIGIIIIMVIVIIIIIGVIAITTS